MNRLSVLPFAFVALLIFANAFSAKGTERKIQVSDFGRTKSGDAIYRYVLSNSKGVEAVVISYGAALVSLKAPDRSGKSADIVLGYDTLDGYEQDKTFFGATIGRYGNRIAGGQFTLDGTVFHLPKNDGPNSLHGGIRGFNKRIWTGVDRSRADAQVLELTYTSPNGEEGYPGTLKVQVTYTLPAEANELRIDYSATTDKDTVVNLTNHSYFNLSGVASQEILEHQLLLRAMEFTPVDSTLIPTGELRAVCCGPFDFTKATAIGARINQGDEQLKFGKGYDHNWVLERTNIRWLAGCRRGVRTHKWASPGSVDDRAGYSVLQWQLPGRQSAWQRRTALRPSHRLLPGNTTFSGFSESSEFSVDGTEAGSTLSVNNCLPAFNSEVGCTRDRKTAGVGKPFWCS